MNIEKYKSVAIDMKTYRLLQALSKKGFGVEISLAQVTREAVKRLAQQKKVA